ncbi:hypothetical protein BIV24_16345 [Streptomyces colonosanans]|uniref:Uncharacterized protein n=1 Tax=Streptomyces colonosanans TaxID=1428652 RepID=A0A1S2PBY1_9ACTN|nr:hypothetical protein BIV24_16345 [Streptomyces colonosanans]
MWLCFRGTELCPPVAEFSPESRLRAAEAAAAARQIPLTAAAEDIHSVGGAALVGATPGFRAVTWPDSGPVRCAGVPPESPIRP